MIIIKKGVEWTPFFINIFSYIIQDKHMEIYHADTGRDEIVFFKEDPSLIMIVGYGSEEDDKYDFSDANFVFLKNQELRKDLKSVINITDTFWSYVPSKDKKWLKQKLIKTVFE